MSNDPRRVEPKTVPPPAGAKDMYSAQTRVGTLPEEVLAAMRAEETDAGLDARTRSGMRPAVRPPALPPPVPPPLPRSSLSPDTPEPLSVVRPISRPPFALDAATAHDEEASVSLLPSSIASLRPSISPTPRWSSAPARASQPPFTLAHTTFPQPLANSGSFIEVIDAMPPARSSLVRSIVVVVLFALLGAVVACAIMFDLT